MNERIKKLYKEATGKDWAYDFDPDVAERFAKLIVRECAVIVGSMEEPHQDIAKLVKRHFGVE
jgi:hypothetical protein